MGKKNSKNLFYNAKFDGDIFIFKMSFFPGKLSRLFGYTTYLEVPLNTTVQFARKDYFLFSSLVLSLWSSQYARVNELKLRKVKVWFFRWDKFREGLTAGILDIFWLSLNKQNVGLMTVREQAAEIALKQLKLHLLTDPSGIGRERPGQDPSINNKVRINQRTVNQAQRVAHLSAVRYCFPSYQGVGKGALIVHTKVKENSPVEHSKSTAIKRQGLKTSNTQKHREIRGIEPGFQGQGALSSF